MDIEIQAKNEVIAKFQGYKYYGWNDPDAHGTPGWKKKPHTHMWMTGYLCRSRNDLKYNCSFDWIMPVAKRCIGLVFDGRTEIYDALHKCEVEAIFEAVYRFIVWLDTDEGKNKMN